MPEPSSPNSATDEVPSANGWFQIAVPSDGAIASIKKIVRHTGKGKPIKSVDILKKLKELKVVYGIDHEKIEKLLKSVDEHDIPETPAIIAKGDVEHGQNGNIDWSIDGITEAGAEFLVVPNIQVCIKKLASKGKKGKNVFGKSSNPRPGIDQPLNCGAGISYRNGSDDEIIYETTHVGLLTYKAGTIAVDSGLVVSEDRLHVHMDIHAGKVYGMDKDVIQEDFMRTLEADGITYGLKTEAIKQALENARASNTVIKKVLIAEGDAAINGSDDVLKWHVDIKAEEIKQRAVIPEQVIATISADIKAQKGIDIFGEDVQAIEGKRMNLQCGKGVVQTESNDAHEYKASCLGIAHFESGAISVKSGVKISDDKMKVSMSLLRPMIEGSEGNILFSHVAQTLNEHNVVYGIKKEAIKLILDNINKSRESKIDLLIAEGKPVKDGVNASVEYDKELFSGGKLLADGRIDFHEKSYPWNVKLDDVIGKLVPAQHSEDGINVHGETILANIVEVAEPILEGISLDDDGSLRVTEPGVLLVNGINFKVSDNLQIDGDVNQKTGNIHCDKTVNVKGYVEPGFTLETKGDAIIQENVEDATVTASGNIIIKSGIRGTHSKIMCNGDLSASFAENAELNAKGDIYIKNNVINCHSVCDGIMHIGEPHSRKSSLSGNITHAYKGIQATALGSDSFIQTIIIAGAGIETTKELMDSTEELKKTNAALEDLGRVYTHYCKNPKPQAEQNVLLLKLEETREIKTQEHEELSSENERLKTLIETSKDAKIIVHKRIYPGVKIILSNKIYEVKEERGSGVFRLQGEKVIFEPT